MWHVAVKGLGFRTEGLGLRVKGLELRVRGKHVSVMLAIHLLTPLLNAIHHSLHWPLYTLLLVVVLDVCKVSIQFFIFFSILG